MSCVGMGEGSRTRGVLTTWLTIWLVSRAVVGAVVVGGALARGVDSEQRASDPSLWLLYRFAHWDSHLYGAIADRGYTALPPGNTYNAFFPGFPAVMRAWTSAFGGDGRWGALLLVTVTTAVAALLLGTLATEVTGRVEVGTTAVLLLAFSPLTIFFSVAYTEGVFLCLSLGAWLLARRHHWALAGVLAGLACTLRVNGAFLVVALIVLHLVRERHGGRWRVGPGVLTLALGPLFILGWMVWLHGLTGQWDAWTSAQLSGWGRFATWPWVGLHDVATNIAAADSWHLLLARWLDVAAWFVAVAAPWWFIIRRNWPIAVLLGLNAVAIVTSSILDSGGRYLLVWFPLYVCVASWLASRPRLRYAVLTASACLALTLSYCWSQQYWVA